MTLNRSGIPQPTNTAAASPPSNDFENRLTRLEASVMQIFSTIEKTESLIARYQGQFIEFLEVMRRSQMQDMRAKERAGKSLRGNNVREAIRILTDESRRADIQMLNYSSRTTGSKTPKEKEDLAKHANRQTSTGPDGRRVFKP